MRTGDKRKPRLARTGSAGHPSITTFTLLAEHGLCLLVKAERDGRTASILLDAGYSPIAAPRNLEWMGEPLEEVRALVVSHGHEDHVGAAVSLLESAGKPPAVVHPSAFFGPRYWCSDDGDLFEVPRILQRDDLSQRGIHIVESEGPTTIADGVFLVTGEIPRETPFELALPGALREVDGQRVPDTVVDDQAVVVAVRDHGVVVISGCAHAGIVNTIRYARELAAMRPLYAVVGGFHLSGTPFREAIAPTIQALRDEHPARLVPMHCTGVEATARMRMAFGDRCTVSAVGTRLGFPFA